MEDSARSNGGSVDGQKTSHVLLDELRGIVHRLKCSHQPVDDGGCHLIPLCETIEAVLRQGLKYPNSWFGLNKQDYWSWIEPLQDYYFNQKENPLLRQVVRAIATSRKCRSVVGRGRCFIRVTLCQKLISVPIEHLAQNKRLTQYWYSSDSIIGDPTLRGVLMGVLFDVTDIDFELSVDNSSFLDESWVIPVYKALSIPPIKTLNIKLSYVDKRALIVEVEKDCLAEKAGVEVGDVLDELCGEPVHGMTHGKLKQILVTNSIDTTDFVIVKRYLPDGSLFFPILQRQLVNDERASIDGQPLTRHKRRPSLKVQTNGSSTEYTLVYLGLDDRELSSTSEPTQEVMDGSISRVLNSDIKPQEVIVSVSPRDVSLLSSESREVLCQFGYTEVCSAGRGETHQTCIVLLATPRGSSLSAYVLETPSLELAQAVCAHIAQGFNRSQWLGDKRDLNIN